MNTDMLTCEDALERMSQALDGPLPLEERQALEEHLESCPECRAAYEALFQMEDALREIGETPAPAELSARVMEQIQAEAAPARRPAPRWNRAGWRNLAGLAACAVLCLGLWHGAGLGSRENVVDEPSAASQSAGQEDASSRGLLDEMEPAQEEDPVDAQPAPAQADAPEEDAPEKAESSLPSGQEEAACPQTEEAPAADTRSILEQESPEVPEAYAHMPDADSSGSQSEQEPATIQEPEGETEPQVQGGAPDALLQDEPELDSQTQGTKQDEQAQEPGPDGAAAEPPENGAAAETAPPPWGEGTALVLSALPQEAEELLPAREEWTQEEDGTRWCTVTAEELEAVQALLIQQGVETELPEQPWTEPCAVVILPSEGLPSSPEEPAN